MAKRVIDLEIPRKTGVLYYVKGDPLEVWESPMKGRKGKKGKR